MENRSNNCKTQSSNQTRGAANRSTNAVHASNEHKHPNQYTKGADDEGAQNVRSAKDAKSAKGSKNCR